MSEQEKHEQQDDQQEQADLEVSEEAEEVEGGGTRGHFGPKPDTQGLKYK